MLNFQSVTLRQKERLHVYFSAYGEGSCQHSFAASFCLLSKYGDRFAEKDGFCFIRRDGRCTAQENIYLFPLGDRKDKDDVRKAVERVLEDGHRQGKTVCFESITEGAKELLEELYPDEFEIREERDLSEYFFSREKLVSLSGGDLRTRRKEVRAFFREYGERCVIEPIVPKYYERILELELQWLSERMEPGEEAQLEAEYRSVQIAMEHFEELQLAGLVVFIDGEMKGFVYGTPLNDEVYDGMVEKGDLSVRHIYPVMNHEFAKRCCEGYRWLNWEEDLGVEGLRRMKLGYGPDHLLKKYIAKERTTGHE